MENKESLTLRLELIWWVFTLILAGGVLFPILRGIDNYPFLMMNIVFVIIFVTFTRYVFLLKHTFFAKKEKIKIVAIIICLPILFYLINGINYFQTFVDEQGIEAVIGALPNANQVSLGRYIRAELIFFGVGAAITCILFPIRLIISIWRLRNRGTV